MSMIEWWRLCPNFTGHPPQVDCGHEQCKRNREKGGDNHVSNSGSE